MSIHLQISSCNYPTSRQLLLPGRIPRSSSLFTCSSLILVLLLTLEHSAPTYPRVADLHPATQRFSALSSFRTAVGRFFFLPFVTSVLSCPGLHYRTDLPFESFHFSRTFLKITSPFISFSLLIAAFWQGLNVPTGTLIRDHGNSRRILWVCD